MYATHFRKSRAVAVLVAFLSLPFWSTHAQTIHWRMSYERWLNEEVRWIITDQERADFKALSSDKQRDQFVEAFWERRNPTPGAPENTFKEEHYRRVSYASQHFSQGVPGWRSDRGRFYIMYGPPDKVIRHPSSAERSNRVQKGRFNSEEWYWTYIEGLGCDVILEFEDKCGCGEYHLRERQGDFRSLRALSPDCLIDQIRFP
jgi:GWxTD domain-containing protein